MGTLNFLSHRLPSFTALTDGVVFVRQTALYSVLQLLNTLMVLRHAHLQTSHVLPYCHRVLVVTDEFQSVAHDDVLNDNQSLVL